MPFAGGQEHFIVVDGYGGSAGEYWLMIDEGWCPIECPPGRQQEDEPFMDDGYEDTHNAGCDAVGDPMLQAIVDDVFCGVSGWYRDAGGQTRRDTDWFTVLIPECGVLELEADAEHVLNVHELGPQDCNTVGAIQTVTAGPCAPMSMVITGTPGDVVWLWAGPPAVSAPVFQFDYILMFSGVVATETHSLSSIKALFQEPG